MLLKYDWTPTSSELSLLGIANVSHEFILFKSPRIQVDAMKGRDISFWSLELSLSAQNSNSSGKFKIKLQLVDTSTTKHLFTTFHLTFKSKTKGTQFANMNKLHVFKKASNVPSETKYEQEFVWTSYYLLRNISYFPFEITCDIKTNTEMDTTDNALGVIPDFEKLLDDEKFSDFNVITTTKKKFKVHKNILASRSEVFSAMFDSDMLEKKKNSVTIEDFDDEVIQELLRYMYCGKVENLEKISASLLKAAEKYLLEGLKIICLEKMCEAVNFTNAIELLSLTIQYKVDFLKSRMMNFIIYNIKYIDKTNLQSLDDGLIEEILLETVKTHL